MLFYVLACALFIVEYNLCTFIMFFFFFSIRRPCPENREGQGNKRNTATKVHFCSFSLSSYQGLEKCHRVGNGMSWKMSSTLGELWLWGHVTQCITACLTIFSSWIWMRSTLKASRKSEKGNKLRNWTQKSNFQLLIYTFAHLNIIHLILSDKCLCVEYSPLFIWVRIKAGNEVCSSILLFLSGHLNYYKI